MIWSLAADGLRDDVLPELENLRGVEQGPKRPRRQRMPKYSYDALKVLQRVWAASGGQCGRYLAASMALQLDALRAATERTIALLKERRAALIAAAVTGKLDVQGAECHLDVVAD